MMSDEYNSKTYYYNLNYNNLNQTQLIYNLDFKNNIYLIGV